ncbi:MAG: hypothetical protein ACKPKO_35200, partial [Candidatus Fonsibacter sp.]
MQHHGKQTVEELNYIMESRLQNGSFIYFRYEEQERRIYAGRPVPRGYHDIFMQRALEQDTDLAHRTEIAIACDAVGALMPSAPPTTG